MTKAATLDELLAKKPASAEAYIVVDSDLAVKWRAARAKVEKFLYSNNEAALRAAREEVDELRPEVEKAERVIRFKALGREAYRLLEEQQEHRPTKKQRQDARDNGLGEIDHNPLTFPPALLAASSVEPKMTLDEATKLWNSETWSSGELMLLYTTAMTVNAGSQVVSLGKESERTQD